LLPDFTGAVRLIGERRAGLRVVVPTVRAMEGRVRAAVASWRPEPIVVLDDAEKFDAFAASDIALAASGTVSLELNLARVPTVIAYRVSDVSAAIVRALVRVRHVTIANLVLGDRSVIPELMQEDCTPENLAGAVLALLDDPAACAEQVRLAAEAMRLLGHGGPPPSLRAAEILLDIAGIARRPRLG
jgi:lipid-A-disaccharide synthase